MNKEQLFKKYSINDTHSEWDESIDNWMSVEVYRLMHDGNLPDPNDLSSKWITDFLDKSSGDMEWWVKNVMSRSDWGSLYLTAKRLVYRHFDSILSEINS